jgi:hypothetical protein
LYREVHNIFGTKAFLNGFSFESAFLFSPYRRDQMHLTKTTGWAVCTSFAGFVIVGTASLGNERAGLLGGLVIFALFFVIDRIVEAVVNLWNGTGGPYIRYDRTAAHEWRKTSY